MNSIWQNIWYFIVAFRTTWFGLKFKITAAITRDNSFFYPNFFIIIKHPGQFITYNGFIVWIISIPRKDISTFIAIHKTSIIKTRMNYFRIFHFYELLAKLTSIFHD